ncbi:hypothetical protein BH23GEM4_BH23GEM4_13910 [soil metagenome]
MPDAPERGQIRCPRCGTSAPVALAGCPQCGYAASVGTGSPVLWRSPGRRRVALVVGLLVAAILLAAGIWFFATGRRSVLPRPNVPVSAPGSPGGGRTVPR